MKKLSKQSASTGLVALAALGVSLPLLYSIRRFPNVAMSYLLKMVDQSDLGNALAALVAIGGYMVDHFNTRRAQKLEAQIQRVASQSQNLLVPVTTQMHSICTSGISLFVDKHIGSTSHIMEEAYGDANYGENLMKEYSQNPMLEVPTAMKNPASAVHFMHEILGGRGSLAKIETFHPAVTSPRELPKFLDTAIQSCERPNSPLWKSYEAFVRHQLLPPIDRVAEIIDESGHLMEPVPAERLTELFAQNHNGFGQKWSAAPRMWFYSMWLNYARSWHSVVAMWDEGCYQDYRPSGPFPCGTLFFNIEAQTIVASVEKELVGMSQMHGSVVNRK